MDGPHKLTALGDLVFRGMEVVANPAFLCGAQKGEKLREVGYLRGSPANAATAFDTPINFAFWDCISQEGRSSRLDRFDKTLEMAKVDDQDAYKHPSPRPRGAFTAIGNKFYGSIPQTRPFGSPLLLHLSSDRFFGLPRFKAANRRLLWRLGDCRPKRPHFWGRGNLYAI